MRSKEEIMSDSNSNTFGGDFPTYQFRILVGTHLMTEVLIDIRNQLTLIANAWGKESNE